MRPTEGRTTLVSELISILGATRYPRTHVSAASDPRGRGGRDHNLDALQEAKGVWSNALKRTFSGGGPTRGTIPPKEETPEKAQDAVEAARALFSELLAAEQLNGPDADDAEPPSEAGNTEPPSEADGNDEPPADADDSDGPPEESDGSEATPPPSPPPPADAGDGQGGDGQGQDAGEDEDDSPSYPSTDSESDNEVTFMAATNAAMVERASNSATEKLLASSSMRVKLSAKGDKDAVRREWESWAHSFSIYVAKVKPSHVGAAFRDMCAADSPAWEWASAKIAVGERSGTIALTKAITEASTWDEIRKMFEAEWCPRPTKFDLKSRPKKVRFKQGDLLAAYRAQFENYWVMRSETHVKPTPQMPTLAELEQKFGADFAGNCARLSNVEWNEIWTQGWMANETAQMLADFYEGLPKELRDRIIEKGDHPTDFEEFYAYTQETLTELDAKRPSSALGNPLVHVLQPERQEEPPDADVAHVSGGGGGKKNNKNIAKAKARPDWLNNRDIPPGYCWRCACEGHTQASCETRPERFRWSQMMRAHDITKAKTLAARENDIKPSWGGKGQKSRGGGYGGNKNVHAVSDAASDAGSTRSTPQQQGYPSQQWGNQAANVSTVSNVQPVTKPATQDSSMETVAKALKQLTEQQQQILQQQRAQPALPPQPPVQQLQYPLHLQQPMQIPTHPFPQNAAFSPPPQAVGGQAPTPFTQQQPQTYAEVAAVDDNRVAGGEDLVQQLRPDGAPFNPDNYDNQEN